MPTLAPTLRMSPGEHFAATLRRPLSAAVGGRIQAAGRTSTPSSVEYLPQARIPIIGRKILDFVGTRAHAALNIGTAGTSPSINSRPAPR
jgi:hypothetical protein